MVSARTRCPTCGDSSPADAIFCISCGASLARPATSTTRLLNVRRPRPIRPRLPPNLIWRWRIKPLLINGGVAVFGLALLTLVILIAYVGSYTPGLGPIGWLFVLAGAIHLVRDVRRGEPLVGMLSATFCAAIPVAQVTQAFITTTVLFGGLAALLVVVQFLVAIIPCRRLAALPTHLRLPEFPDLLLVHGSLRSDADVLPAHTPAETLPALFPDGDEGLILRAHDHVGATYLWGKRRIITVGSVGLPLNGIPTAQYLLLEWQREGWHTAHQSVPYDLAAALRRFEQSGYLAEAGVMARLFQRELATASFQLVPFLRFYRQLCLQAPVDLEEGLRRFLAV